jgi:hypothetical protein
MKWTLLLVGFLMLAACTRLSERRTPLVEKVEKAGAGDLSTASSDAMTRWLEDHQQIAAEVNQECEPLRVKATAAWNNSTEGRLCQAAAVAKFFNSTPSKGDGKTYQAGTK